jgi:prefoldin subunit 5
MDSYTQELQQMDQRLTDLEDKIDSIDTKLTQVVDAILGNPLTKTGGFMKDIDVLKERIAKLESAEEEHLVFKKQISWTVGIIISIGVVIQFLVNVYSNLKH